MARRRTHAVGAQVRLASLDILRRKAVALRVWPPAPGGMVAAVFNSTEIAVLKRLAAGERVVGVELSSERAASELAWIARGGRYEYDDAQEGA